MQNVFFFVKLQKQIVQYLIKDSLSKNMVKIDAIEDKFRQMVLIILSSNRYFFVKDDYMIPQEGVEFVCFGKQHLG